MLLRFSSRGDQPDAVIHLTVTETLRSGNLVRRRGEALCRPRTSLPNLEILDRQVLGEHRCCEACVDVMAKLRVVRHVELPASAGIVAGDLVRDLEKVREAERPAKPRKRATSLDRESPEKR